jgi:dihydropteroate synthase
MKHPILIGVSRKSFLGGTIESRDERGLPLSAIAYLNGASIIRSHNVKGTKEFFEKFNS